MKNVFKIANGQWRFESVVNGKRTIKTFKSKLEAQMYAKDYQKARAFDLAYFFNLSDEQRKDIKDAILELPDRKTLLESVRKAWQFHSEANLHDIADQYEAIKKAKHDSNMLSHGEYTHISGRINNFKENFNSFSELQPNKLLEYLRSKGTNKTVNNWRGTISEMLDFAVSRGAITSNPLKQIHSDEFIKAQPLRQIGFLSVEVAKAFMEYIETIYPQYARFYALALFCGIRIEEVPRLNDNYFRYDEKKIVFPAQIGKIKKAWTLEDLPDNLWVWLEKYKNTPIKRPSNTLRTTLGEKFNLPKNFTRHSFATYHLSLYFDLAKTAKITRNSEQMLRDHYWGSLTEKEVAKAYFEILPKIY